MKSPRFLPVLGLLAGAVLPLAAAGALIPLEFTPATMDRTVSPGADFNLYANGG